MESKIKLHLESISKSSWSLLEDLISEYGVYKSLAIIATHDIKMYNRLDAILTKIESTNKSVKLDPHIMVNFVTLLGQILNYYTHPDKKSEDAIKKISQNITRYKKILQSYGDVIKLNNMIHTSIIEINDIQSKN